MTGKELAQLYIDRKAVMYFIQRYLNSVKEECCSIRRNLSSMGCYVETTLGSDSVSIDYTFLHSKTFTLERAFPEKVVCVRS